MTNVSICESPPESSDVNVDDIICLLCHGGETSEGNDIILCDGETLTGTPCENAYHQLCHVPPVFVLLKSTPWVCLDCHVKDPNSELKPQQNEASKTSTVNPLETPIQMRSNVIAFQIQKELTRLRNSIVAGIRKVKSAEDVVRAYTESRHSQQLLAKGKPPSELLSSRKRLAKAKLDVRGFVVALDEYITAKPLNDEPRFDTCDNDKDKDGEEDGGVDSSEIVCTICRQEESTDENDVLLCDGCKCFRAFHMKCVFPVVEQEEMQSWDENDGEFIYYLLLGAPLFSFEGFGRNYYFMLGD